MMNPFPFFPNVSVIFRVFFGIGIRIGILGFCPDRHSDPVYFFQFFTIPFFLLFAFFRRTGTLINGIEINAAYDFDVFDCRLRNFKRCLVVIGFCILFFFLRFNSRNFLCRFFFGNRLFCFFRFRLRLLLNGFCFRFFLHFGRCV